MRVYSCLRHLAVTAAFVLGWYVLLRMPIVWLFPEDTRAPIDTFRTNSSLASAAPNIVLYEIDRLARPARHRMVLVGSSNVVYALRPEDLREQLPGWEVHNLAIPTSNVQQAAQTIDMVLALSDSTTLRRTTFTLGTYFGSYAPRKALWGGPRSPLTKEMLRYGLYRERDSGDPRPLLGYALAPVTKELYRTFLGTRALVDAAGRNAELLWKGKRLDLGAFVGKREHPYKFRQHAASRATKKKNLAWRAKQMGSESTLVDEQFQILEQLSKRVRRAGARLLIVELPTPGWARQEHYDFYWQHKQAFVAGLARAKGVDYRDLSGSVPDDLMADSTHMVRSGARLYAKAFGDAVRSLEVPLP